MASRKYRSVLRRLIIYLNDEGANPPGTATHTGLRPEAALKRPKPREPSPRGYHISTVAPENVSSSCPFDPILRQSLLFSLERCFSGGATNLSDRRSFQPIRQRLDPVIKLHCQVFFTLYAGKLSRAFYYVIYMIGSKAIVATVKGEPP